MRAEVPASRGFDPVQSVAEVDLVQIELEDLVLRVGRLELRREDDFLQLAPQRLVAREEALPRELLRQRAAALRPPAFTQVCDRRPDNPDGVDAAMVVEPLVLDGENRLPGDGRDLAQRHLNALFLEQRVDRLVLPIEQRRRLGHVADAAEALATGHRGGKIDREPYQPDCNDPRHGDEAAQADEKSRFPLRKR